MKKATNSSLMKIKNEKIILSLINQSPISFGTNSYNEHDKMLCSDALSTEKFVSSTYNTTIFEFRDKNNCKRVYEFIVNDSADEKPQKLSNDELNNLLISLGDEFYKNVDYEKRITKEHLKKNELLEKLEAKNNEIKLKNNEIDLLNKELERKQKQIDTLLNSNSWKVTKPLRKTTEMLKNNKGD